MSWSVEQGPFLLASDTLLLDFKPSALTMQSPSSPSRALWEIILTMAALCLMSYAGFLWQLRVGKLSCFTYCFKLTQMPAWPWWQIMLCFCFHHFLGEPPPTHSSFTELSQLTHLSPQNGQITTASGLQPFPRILVLLGKSSLWSPSASCLSRVTWWQFYNIKSSLNTF